MINEQILTSSLTLHPEVLNGDIDNIIKEKVKSEFEGKCHDDGYIINSSISNCLSSDNLNPFGPKSLKPLSSYVLCDAVIITPRSALNALVR